MSWSIPTRGEAPRTARTSATSFSTSIRGTITRISWSRWTPWSGALKDRGRTTVQVRFPGESHELSRSGKPVHRVERLQHILNWFDKYLLGKPTKLYDVQ